MPELSTRDQLVKLHIVHQLAPQRTVCCLDTDLFFPETYNLKDELRALGGTR